MRCCLIVLLCLHAVTGHSQVFHTLLNGRLMMQTGETFPYVLSITDSQSKLYGFSLTFNAPNDTKTLVTGTIDKGRGILAFNEESVEYSHSLPTKAFMCLLHGKLVYKNGMLNGPVVSQQSDHTACTSGQLEFNEADKIQSLFSTHDKYDMEVTMGSKQQTVEMPVKALKVEKQDIKPLEKITEGIEKSYEWHSDSIIIEVWDGGTLDGDVISISFDGKVVLDNYSLRTRKKRISLALGDYALHTLSVLSVSEGTEPPATATLTLLDGSVLYNVVAYNKKNAVSVLRIRRVK